MKKLKKILLYFLICTLVAGTGHLLIKNGFPCVTVQAAPIKLNKTNIVMAVGTKYTLKLQGASKKVNWASSDKKVVTVSSKGEITARNKGTAKIRAIYNSQKYFCTVTVEAPKLNKSKLTLTQGETYQLAVSGTKQKVTWSSSAPLVSCSKNGTIKALKPGTAKIRAVAGRKKLFCTVTVKETSTDTGNPSPAFPWENYKVMAHALGAVNGQVYLNSKESFIESYSKGYRLFEIDLSETSDGVWVCRHNWKESLGQWEGGGKKILTAKEFLSTPIYGKYTPMSLKDLFVLLKDYPDAYVLFDSKKYSARNYSNTLKDYREYINIAKEAGAADTLKRIIPQVYNESMYSAVKTFKVFPAYLYSLWQDYPVSQLVQIADFCKKNGIYGVTISRTNWSKEVQKLFSDRGIFLYVYTVNQLSEAKFYMAEGAAGICTDMITIEELLN